MKRFILLLVLIFSICSCNYNVNNDITTYVIKFKDATEVEMLAADCYTTKQGYVVCHEKGQHSIFNIDEVVYILKK
jgi:hypothetical protein